MLFLMPLFLAAQSLELKNLRTDLYSKTGANTLKKVELSLEFEGESLKGNENKLYDSTLSVISGFFYEDVFTEVGKNNFKETLKRVINKKYKMNIKNIYILSISGVQKFDLEEFKRFLKDADTKSKKDLAKEIDKIEQNTSLNAPQVPKVPDVGLLLNENSEDLNVDDIDSSLLNIPSLPENTPIKLKDQNATGFSIDVDNNASVN